MNKIFLFLIILTLLLTGCLGDIDNPVADAKKTRIELLAQEEARSMEQARIVAENEEAWEQAKRAEKSQFWESVQPLAQSLGKVLTAFVYLGLIAIVLSVAWSISYGTVKTAEAYGIKTHIQARALSLDQNGMRQQFLWDDVKKIPANTFLGRLGIQHVRETKYWLNDTATGQSGMINTEKPASNAQLEVYRQVLIHKLTLDAQKSTALFSKNGEVADAMGQSAFELPDAGLVLLGYDKENDQGFDSDNHLLERINQNMVKTERGL